MLPDLVGFAGTEIASRGTDLLLEKGWSAYRSRKLAAVERILENAAAGMNFGSVEEAHRYLLENVDAPWFHESVAQMVRELLEAPDEAAYPYFARLLAWQFTDRVVPSRMAKKAMAMLTECDQSIIDRIQVLTAETKKRYPETDPFIILIYRGELRKGISPKPGERARPEDKDYYILMQTSQTGDSHENPHPRLPYIADREAISEVFSLWKRYDFGADNVSGSIGAEGGPHVVRLSRAAVEFLERLFRRKS